MTPAQRFFHKHAGYSYDPKTQTPEQGRKETARRLAAAETYARAAGWSADWIYDPEGCIGCDCGHPGCACSNRTPHEVFACLLRDGDGSILASLGSICGASDEYRRVIEAELALEAMPA